MHSKGWCDKATEWFNGTYKLLTLKVIIYIFCSQRINADENQSKSEWESKRERECQQKIYVTVTLLTKARVSNSNHLANISGEEHFHLMIN